MADVDDQMTRQRRLVKVLRLRILKPADQRPWPDLAELLREVRYRVFRLGNLMISEHYLAFHRWRCGETDEYLPPALKDCNRRLRQMLVEEAEQAKGKKGSKERKAFEPSFFSPTGALNDFVAGALNHNKIRALTTPSKWREVMRGHASLPTFRIDGPIYISATKPGYRRLERMENGDVHLDLMICRKPYPRVVLATKEKGVGEGQLAILNRLLDNPSQSLEGYRQRYFEIKHDDRDNKWWLHITYDFPADVGVSLSPDVVVGVDVGFACPLVAAISNGHARLGRRQFAAVGARIRGLQRQVIARRRSIQTGGRVELSKDRARSGHGRRRRLQAILPIEGRIQNAYRTLNHQLSTSVVKFARSQGAGVIQVEDLKGLNEALRGTFIGMRWRYHELLQDMEYKAKEAGLEFRKINPRFTSRRCHVCGWINQEFDRVARDAAGRPGFSARFSCVNPACSVKNIDADYNAAKNIATLDIESKIVEQCKRQGIPCRDAALSQDDSLPPETER